MEEKLFPLTFPPGLYQNGTVYQSKGRWYNGNLVRFFQRTIRNVGAWTPMLDGNGAALATLSPMMRCAIAWRNTDGSLLYAFAGTAKLQVVAGGTLYDETPAGFTTGLVNAGTTTPGAYGNAAYGAGVYGTGATGLSTVDPDTWTLDIFGNYLVGVSTSDTKLYVWQAATGTAAATPTWGLTTTGSIVTSGSTAGGASSIILTATTMTGTLLQGQTFTVSGTMYTATANATAAAGSVTVAILPTVPATISTGTAVTGTTNQAPLCRAVVVTPEKFLVALGAGDPRTVQWASQATYAVWGPLAANSAGSFPLTTKGRIMAGAATASQTLIWTDADLWLMVYQGPPAIYGFQQVGAECGLIAPNAKVIVNSTAYWMGRTNFYMYNGYVQPIPCDVYDAIFPVLNDVQRAKIWAQSMPQYNEIWWYYPTVNGGNEIANYVIYNHVEQHWSLGTMARTCGIESGPIQYPIMVDTAGEVWQHEIPGLTIPGIIAIDGQLVAAATPTSITASNSPNMTPNAYIGYTVFILSGLGAGESVTVTGNTANAFNTTMFAVVPDTTSVFQVLVPGQTAPFLQSGPVEIGAGDVQGYGRTGAGEQMMKIQRIVPDQTTPGQLALTMTTALYPTDPSPVTTVVGTMQTPTDVRLTARQVQITFTNPSALGPDWRIGTVRLGIRPGGKR